MTLSNGNGSILHLVLAEKKAEHLPPGRLAVTTERHREHSVQEKRLQRRNHWKTESIINSTHLKLGKRKTRVKEKLRKHSAVLYSACAPAKAHRSYSKENLLIHLQHLFGCLHFLNLFYTWTLLLLLYLNVYSLLTPDSKY